jgi:hypothetical protein
MRLPFIVTIICIFSFIGILKSQSDTTNKVDKISGIRETNNKYSKRIDAETAKSKEFFNLAVTNLQSAKQILGKLTEGSPTENSDKDMADILIKKATLYMQRSDSVSKIAAGLQDSINNNVNRINKIYSDWLNKDINPKK